MKKMLEIINNGTDEEILKYVKMEFKGKLPLYINILDKSAQMQKEINLMKAESQSRIETIDELSKFMKDGVI